MENIFIVNKASKTGKTKELWNRAEAHLKENDIEYKVFFTNGTGDATRFAKESTGASKDVALFVMGGDGTLNEALNGIVDFEHTIYTPLPSGSGNDFVNGIGMRGDALEILDRALKSHESKMLDIGRISYIKADTVESRLFGVSSGIGVDAYVCLQALDSKLKRFLNIFGAGSATYGLLTVGDIFTMPFSDASINVYFNGEVTSLNVRNTIFAAAMNCRVEGGGIPMAPDAKADSGHLTAFIAHDISRLKCFLTLPKLVAGKHVGLPGFDLLNFDKIEISMKEKMCVHTDGEHIGFYDNITFECMPHTLKVRGF